MKRTGLVVSGIALATGLMLFAFPFRQLIDPSFIDSRRAIISSQSSPDGKRIAQVERFLVGGVPSIVVTVRPWWKPDWYLSSCAAASHYREANAALAWLASSKLEILSNADPLFWDVGEAPYHNEPCPDLAVTIVRR